MIVGAFVVGAVFTPPDVVSQLMLAVPLWLLYELGILLRAVRGRRRCSGEATREQRREPLGVCERCEVRARRSQELRRSRVAAAG